MLTTAHEWWLAGAVIALVALSPAAAYLYYSRPSHRGSGRHILGRPVFDGDAGPWPATGPAALLLDGLPRIDWHTAPPPDMAEHHADFFGAPPPKYTELDAFRGEAEAAERLATTDTRFMLAAIVRGLEYRDLIDAQAGLITERVLAELSLIDIAADLS